MSYFKNYIIIILCLFLNINALSYRLLQKYGEVENSDGTVIFESKDFSDGNKMHFRVSLEQECKSDLKYKYYSTKEEISTTDTDYKVSYKSSETTKAQNTIIVVVNYYTIEKKSSEYKGSNGNYLLLTIDCNGGKINFQNTEKDESKDSTNMIVIIVVVVVVMVIAAVVIGICIGRIKAKAAQSQIPPYVVYGTPQMYPQQGNMPIAYGGQPVIIGQTNGIPNNNNPNMQYSNLPANASMNQMNQLPNQKYNMIGQSSADRGYSSNVVNEKGEK